MMSRRNLAGLNQAAILAIVVMVLVVVSSMDFEDELKDQQAYCDNVKAGYWPDYNQNAAEVCR